MKLGIWTDDNVLIMHVILIFAVAWKMWLLLVMDGNGKCMVTEIVKMLQKHMDPR